MQRPLETAHRNGPSVYDSFEWPAEPGVDASSPPPQRMIGWEATFTENGAIKSVSDS
ncbi:hypothetical protein [Streptomyces sp. NPDC088246]|uniref:hypothetical protein n=1 Tax=Streptomyces sp. NPDC088246 TaxID=3365842 RepID=UPI00380B4C2E